MKGWDEHDSNASHFWGTATKDNVFWNALLEHEPAWLLVDLHSGDLYEDGLPPCNVVVTSNLRDGGWPDLDSGGDLLSRKLFMAPMSLEEVKQMKPAVSFHIPDSELEDRYDRFGGSARMLLSHPVSAQQKVEEAFQMGVSILLDPNTKRPVLASTIVHMVANDNFERVGRKYPSPKIAERCVDAVIANRNLVEEIWWGSSVGKTGMDIMGARGMVVERLWHRVIQDEKQICVKELFRDGSTRAVERKRLAKPFLRKRQFSKVDLSDLVAMHVGDYGFPDHNEFQAVDAIAVLDGNPWSFESDNSDQSVANDSQKLVGIMLQMVIGGAPKKAPGTTLMAIDDKMDELVPGFTASQSPLYLIYVTESVDGFSNAIVHYSTAEGQAYQEGRIPKQLARIRQFAISFK